MTKASRWCNPVQVSHELRTAYSERRCRECVGVIGRNDPYWRCCAECHPLCPACFEAQGPEAKRLAAPPSSPAIPAAASAEEAGQANVSRTDAAL